MGKHLSTIGITLLCILIKIENNRLHIQQYEIGNFMYLRIYIETIQLSKAIYTVIKYFVAKYVLCNGKYSIHVTE